MPHDGDTDADVRARARRIARDVTAAEREAVEATGGWPSRTMDALARDGLLGLLVPREVGGMGAGFRGLVAVCEELGREYPSAGLAFGMHCVGTACIAARASPDQAERYLRPIAEGRHVTTLALSEAGTGVHFYLPVLEARRDDGGFVLTGRKTFVTNAGHVQSYVVSTASLRGAQDPGRFNLVVVDADAPNVHLGREWRGVGMRGNSARPVEFASTRVPAANLLGAEGAETWYVFEVVAPYFLAAMAGTYLGVAARAVDEVRRHMERRAYAVIPRGLADSPVLQSELAEIWTRVDQSRAQLTAAAVAADAGEASAAMRLMSAKAGLDEAVTHVTTRAMRLGGGRAYGENDVLAMLHRDALASQVMAPTTTMLKLWVGRSLLGLPLLDPEV